MAGCKMNSVGLGLSLGILWGLSVFLMGLAAFLYSYGTPFVVAVGTLYIGYEPSLIGAVIGGAIGFFDAFITGFLIAWLYNRFTHCGCGCCKKDDKTCG